MVETNKLFGMKRRYWILMALGLLLFSYYLDGSWQCLFNKEDICVFTPSRLNIDIWEKEISPNFYYVYMNVSSLFMFLGVMSFFTGTFFWNFILYGFEDRDKLNPVKE